MAWDLEEDRRKDPSSCNPSTCQYHYFTERVISDLKNAVEQLLEGQRAMSDTIVKLTENVKAIEKLDVRLEKLEDLQRNREKEQLEKLDEVRRFMWKVAGAISVIAPAIAILTKIFVGV